MVWEGLNDDRTWCVCACRIRIHDLVCDSMDPNRQSNVKEEGGMDRTTQMELGLKKTGAEG